MPGARPHPQPCVRLKKAHKSSHHRYAETIRHSLRDGFTAYIGLSPETGLDCLRRLRNSFRKLDASVGASGRHGFAVRASLTRLLKLPRPPRPAPRFVTTARTPLLPEQDGGE